MNWDLIGNIVFGAIGFVALVLQHFEIKKLKRDLKGAQFDAAVAHNNLSFWQDMSDKWRGKFEIANALNFEKDPLKLGVKPNSADIARSRAARNAPTLGDAVKAARKDATGNEEPPTPKQGFA